MTSRSLRAAVVCLLVGGVAALPGAVDRPAAAASPTAATSQAASPPAAPAATTPAGHEPTVGVDYADARKIAAGRKVPVLIEFYTDW